MNMALLTKAERQELAASIDHILGFLLYVPIGKEASHGEIEQLEKQMRNILGKRWNTETKKAVEVAIEQMRQLGEPLTPEKLDMVLKSLDSRLGAGMAIGTAEKVAAVVTAAYLHGRKQFIKDPKTEYTLSLIDQQASRILKEHTVYWIGNYYTQELGETIANKVKELAVIEGLGRKEVGKALKEMFSEQFGRSNAYWRGLAANTVNRARNLGAIESMVEAEITEYEIVAVMDERTSDICREMNGRIIRIEKAVELRDALINAKTPDDVKSIAPWVKGRDVRGKTTKSLPTGMSAPPYHFHCRTTMVIRSSVERKSDTIIPEHATTEYEQHRVSREQKETLNYLKSLTPEERTNKINALAHNVWPEKKAEGHLKHKELGINDPKELIQAAQGIIKNPDKMMAFFDKNNHLQYAFIKGGEDWRIAILDADTQEIKTFYGPKKEKMVSVDQRIVDGKRSQGWVELFWKDGK